MAIVHAIRPRRAVIPAPSFSGYEYAMQAVDGEIDYCLLAEAEGFDPDFFQERLVAMLTAETDILFLANPNNPTGKLMSEVNVHHLLDHCREQGIFVVMDECFIDFCADAESALRWVKKYENLMVVQAFTKIYAIPGLRLGYLVCGNKSLREESSGMECVGDRAGGRCDGCPGARLRDADTEICAEAESISGSCANGFWFPGL